VLKREGSRARANRVKRLILRESRFFGNEPLLAAFDNVFTAMAKATFALFKSLLLTASIAARTAERVALLMI
jgi:hypothetical protein